MQIQSRSLNEGETMGTSKCVCQHKKQSVIIHVKVDEKNDIHYRNSSNLSSTSNSSYLLSGSVIPIRLFFSRAFFSSNTTSLQCN